MHDAILTMAALDPLHNGHLEFFKKGAQIAKTLDVYVSKRGSRRELFLPYEIRVGALEAIAASPELNGSLNVLDENPGLFELATDIYAGLLIGSDLANQTYSEGKPGFMHRIYQKFGRLLIVQRTGYELTEKALMSLESFQLEIFDPVSDISGREIRRLIRLGTDVKQFIPRMVYPIVEPYFHLIKNRAD